MSAFSRVLSVRTSSLIHGCPSHSHPNWEIIYQLEGCASETVGNDAWDLLPGTITLIPAGVPHTKESPGGFRDASMLVSHLDFASHPFTVRDTDGSIRTLTELLIRTRIRQDTGWESEADALLEAITVFIRLRMDKSPRWAFAEAFKSTLYENIQNADFDLTEAIRRTGFHPDYFRRCFRETVGTTPLAYLTGLRINKAKLLLLDSSFVSVAQVAAQCGFSDSFYFSSRFRRAEGCSPMQYRTRGHRKNEQE